MAGSSCCFARRRNLGLILREIYEGGFAARVVRRLEHYAVAMCFRCCENQGEHQHELDPCEFYLSEKVMVVASEVVGLLLRTVTEVRRWFDKRVREFQTREASARIRTFRCSLTSRCFPVGPARDAVALSRSWCRTSTGRTPVRDRRTRGSMTGPAW